MFIRTLYVYQSNILLGDLNFLLLLEVFKMGIYMILRFVMCIFCFFCCVFIFV